MLALATTLTKATFALNSIELCLNLTFAVGFDDSYKSLDFVIRNLVLRQVPSAGHMVLFISFQFRYTEFGLETLHNGKYFVPLIPNFQFRYTEFGLETLRRLGTGL